ncbi:DUF2946 domain-containing protein [Larsenimonas salina]|uniref:DUF2946 domain-containing protein n=1 Tax=Larsenimonas salina TaxID=1295565 RepID=UPI0020744B57|nr:DUF2946 domain-containing protein [Larsenimonas salina]MCM5704869.1 DUF2946 domain-containing protein [Larsenimonas salina]
MRLSLRRPAPNLAWIAILAMALLFAAPVVSQTLHALDRASASSHSNMMMAHSAHEERASDHHSALIACGYCVLFAHVPTLPLGVFTPPAFPEFARDLIPRGPPVEVRAPLPYRPSLPRAPPQSRV